MTTKKNEPRPARSLTATLATAFFALSMVILLLNSSISLYSNYASLRDTMSAQQLLIAQEAGNTVANSIQEKFSVLETAVEFGNPSTADAKTKQTALENLLGLQPAFGQLAMLNASGRQVAQISRQSSNLSEQFEAQLTDDILSQVKGGQRYISSVYIDDLTSEPLLVIAVPAKNVFGDFQGVLVAELNLKFMWDLVDQLEVGETGYAYVVDNQGNLIAFGDTARVLRGENVQQLSEVREFLNNLDKAADVTPEVASYAGLLGEKVVGTYVPLGTPQWAVVVELPTAEANQSIIQFWIGALATILVFAVLATGAGFILARRLAAPLIDLSNAATEIGSGNFALQAKVAGPAEIAKVAETFNTMTSRLRDLIGSLEQRVSDRTKDLATVAEVGTATATILETDKLLQAVVDLTKERFNLYHSHIYLLDEKGENLVLTAGAGEPGRIMAAEKRFIPLNREQSLVARAAREQKGVTVNDVTQTADFLPNPLLPNTRSELAVPMIVGSRVIGVFDVQSDKVGRFTESDINIQTTLAAQVATSIQNVRSFEQSKAQADLESLVNTIGQKIQRTTSVEDTLQTAIREIGLALGATRVSANVGTSRLHDNNNEANRN